MLDAVCALLLLALFTGATVPFKFKFSNDVLPSRESDSLSVLLLVVVLERRAFEDAPGLSLIAGIGLVKSDEEVAPVLGELLSTRAGILEEVVVELFGFRFLLLATIFSSSELESAVSDFPLSTLANGSATLLTWGNNNKYTNYCATKHETAYGL